MSDYSKSVIYKFHKDDLPEIYIGSTHDEKLREQKHKSNCNNENYEYYNLKVYEFIRANGGYDNWKFEVLEHYPCENRTQLRIREQYYYDLLKPLLNTYRPYISEEEMKEENKERCAKYYEEHKEEISKYYQDNKEEFKIKDAKRYQDNREYKIKRTAKHYQDNKDEILKKRQNIIKIIEKKYVKNETKNLYVIAVEHIKFQIKQDI